MSDHHSHGADNETMGVHGMLLFGDHTHYLSHLPMFGSPHNFQVLLEVTFDDATRDILLADRHVASDGDYTFVPEPFPIVELDTGSLGERRTSIAGGVFRGHFERGGTSIAHGVAQVQNVVYFSELDIAADGSNDRTLAYRYFGTPHRLYLAHEIATRPNFDHLLTARFVAGTATNPSGDPTQRDATEMGFTLAARVEFPDRRDTLGERLKPHEIIQASLISSLGPDGSHGFHAQIEVGTELYLESDELT